MKYVVWCGVGEKVEEWVGEDAFSLKLRDFAKTFDAGLYSRDMDPRRSGSLPGSNPIITISCLLYCKSI